MSADARRWHVVEDTGALAAVVFDAIARVAGAAIEARGRFIIVLAGGSTPREIYRQLVALDTDWNRWHVYFGDERCLPGGHADRNDTMAKEVWLDAVTLPPRQIHRIPAELGPVAGAAAYERELAAVDQFDLTLLGIGEDGHTASLFPGHPRGDGPEAPDALAVRRAPKPPPERVTMSASRLGRSRAVFVLATGAGKRAALAQLRDGGDIPLRSVSPPGGLDIFLDRAARPPRTADGLT